MFQATDRKKSKDVKMSINQPPLITPNKFFGESINIKTYVESTKEMFQELIKYNMLNSSILLKTVEIKAKPVEKSLLNVPYSANASGAVDKVITEKMLEGAIDIYSPFYKTAGVTVKNGILFRNRASSSLSSNPPMMLLVDGVQVPADFITNINPADVAGIEILTSNYNLSVLGPDAAGGAVYITTKRGTPGDYSPATNTAKITDAGFSTIKEFYSPDYDDPKTNQQFQDLRSTIYWNPILITDRKGLAKFNFFNASTPGNYRITIEGIDAFGNIGRKVYTYVVK